MTTVHGWAGSPPMRLAVEVPDDARAGVVICPPVGQETVIAYRALRFVAAELARHGIASVRYDPHGHGDSAPAGDGASAVRGALEAADVLRGIGCAEPGFVGLASGALVAAEAAARSGATLVVWDPPASGRAWLRRQRALATLSIVPSPTDVAAGAGHETLVGVDLAPLEVAELQALRVASTTGQPTLAAVRPGATVPAGLAEDVDRIEVHGMPELLDGDSISAQIPGAAVDAVVDWLRSRLVRSDGPLGAPRLDPELRLDDGVTEVVRHLGPDELFAIETLPARVPADTAPLVLLHNGGAEHRVGAADYQVALARALAADGVRVVRLDRRGTGESGAVSADERGFLFTQEWIDDQDAVLAELAVPGDRLAVVGMCAGAWLAGLAAGHAPRLVVEISPNDYRRVPLSAGDYQDNLAAILAEDVSALRLRLRGLWNRAVPERVRDLLIPGSRRDGVAATLVPLARAGTAVTMLLGPEDARLFDELGGAATADRLPGVDVVRVPDGDHALFSSHMRSVVIDEVRRRVAESFVVESSSASVGA